jgi:hypothetical protein
MEAEPAFSASSKACTTLRDHSTSEAEGDMISFAMGT